MSPRLKLLLAVSLALNLFAVGGVAGALIMGVRLHAPPVAPPPPTAPARASSIMNSEDGLALRAKLRAAAEAGEADRQVARQARRDAIRLIGEEPYDPQAVVAAFARSRAGEMAARARIEAALADGLQGVEASRRAEFAKQLVRPPRGRRGPPPPPKPPQPPQP